MDRFERIAWHAFLHVRTEKAATKVVQRMADAIGADLAVDSYSRYWKVPEWADTRLTSPLQVDGVEQAVFHALVVAQRLARGWNVSGPFMFEGGIWTFSGVAAANGHATFTVPGPTWIEFDITNGTSSAPRP